MSNLSSPERLLLDARIWLRKQVDYRLFVESLPSLLLSGCGLLLSGVTLSYLTQQSAAFRQVPALVVLVPVLLGLKCCLELTLASRLTTAFHTDLLSDDKAPNSQRNAVIQANLGVVVIQAIVVALLAVVFAALITTASEGLPSLHDLAVIFSSSVLTSFIAASLLGLFTAYVIIESSRRNVDPDNIAGPLVTGMGDLLAVLLLGGTSFLCFHFPVLTTLATLLVLSFLPVFKRLAHMHRPTAVVLENGWTPILVNLALSLVAGSFLESDVDQLTGGLATLIPVINGTGGNISGIYASRYSTALHKGKKHGHETTSTTLQLASLPAHVCFLAILFLSPADTSKLGLAFVPAYLAACAAQIFLLLLLGRQLAKRAWARDLDPDNHVVPYLTSLSDLFGTSSIVVLSKLL